MANTRDLALAQLVATEPGEQPTSLQLLAHRYAANAWPGKRSEVANIVTVDDFISYCGYQWGVEAVSAITQSIVDGYQEFYRAHGYSASSLNTKGSVIAGFIKWSGRTDLKVKFYGRGRQLKWSLSDDDYVRLINNLTNLYPDSPIQDAADAYLMRAYLVLTVETGLRVEEVLRLVAQDFDLTDPERPILFVPGTKNVQSAARIAISKRAGRWARSMIGDVAKRPPGSPQRLFDIPYRKLWDLWDKCRTFLGLQDEPTATLKGLRRTFAARCLRKGIPIEMIRELMRHASMQTTLSYLAQFGLSDNDETRALLNKQLGGQLFNMWERGFDVGVLADSITISELTTDASSDRRDALRLLAEAIAGGRL